MPARPLILVTADRRPGVAGPGPRIRPGRMEVVVGERVVDRVREAGGVALVVPPGDAAAVGALLDVAVGVVITGGAFDIHPRHYGQAATARLDRVDEDRTSLELTLARACVERRVPVLGVCGGMQALVVARGGTLLQDIATLLPGALDHEQATDPATPGHALVVDPAWSGLLGGAANSTHHQAVHDPGPFRVIARAPDGVIEAVALDAHPFCVGAQWHPELLVEGGALFRALVAAARLA